MLRNRWSSVLTALVAVAAIAVGVPGARASEPIIRMDGCAETFLLADVDGETLAARVPAAYQPAQVAGRGLLWSISSACRQVSVHGGRADPGVVHFVGAEIEPPDGAGPDDINSAVLWILTDRADVRGAMRQAGLPAYRVPGLRYTLIDGTAVATATLDAPWRASAYSIGSSSTPVVTHPHAHDAYWWGSRGRAVVHHGFSTERLSDCGITSLAEGKLAEILGATERTVPCFLQTELETSVEIQRLP